MAQSSHLTASPGRACLSWDEEELAKETRTTMLRIAGRRLSSLTFNSSRPISATFASRGHDLSSDFSSSGTVSSPNPILSWNPELRFQIRGHSPYPSPLLTVKSMPANLPPWFIFSVWSIRRCLVPSGEMTRGWKSSTFHRFAVLHS